MHQISPLTWAGIPRHTEQLNLAMDFLIRTILTGYKPPRKCNRLGPLPLGIFNIELRGESENFLSTNSAYTHQTHPRTVFVPFLLPTYWHGGGVSSHGNWMYDVFHCFLLDEYHQRTRPAYVCRRIDTSLVRLLAPVPGPETAGPLLNEQTQKYLFRDIGYLRLPCGACTHPPWCERGSAAGAQPFK